jgi:hypothetical protein
MLLHFMDAAGPELRTQSAGVSLLQLQSLLEGAVRGSSAAADPEAARLAAAWDHRSILTMLIASQQALTAAAGAEGAARTPFSKVGRCCLLGRGGVAFRWGERLEGAKARAGPASDILPSPAAPVALAAAAALAAAHLPKCCSCIWQHAGRCLFVWCTPPLPPAPPLQLKPATPAPMTASERSTVGKKRIVRESFMLSYEVRLAALSCSAAGQMLVGRAGGRGGRWRACAVGVVGGDGLRPGRPQRFVVAAWCAGLPPPAAAVAQCSLPYPWPPAAPALSASLLSSRLISALRPPFPSRSRGR